MTQSTAPRSSSPRQQRIVILGGGFGGVQVAHHLERLFRRRNDVEITLISQDNFFLVTPLLFEACSGILELRHCSVPIRAFLRRTKFIESTVERPPDLEARSVHLAGKEGSQLQVPYDQLVLALGAWTNEKLIPGSEHAFTFKTLADAMTLRNHVIERFERADAEPDPKIRQALLSFVVVGGGLVGTELFGELTAFADDVIRHYPTLRRDELRFFLFEYSARIMPEMDPALARYACEVLERRRGVVIRTSTPVKAIEPGAVRLADERIEAGTIVLAAGTVPNPVVAALPLDKTKAGHVITDAMLRTSRPDVWALGDCASVPAPNGKPYPYLAQHALREAKQLAKNLHAVSNGMAPGPFVFETLGVMASLGHQQGLGRVLFFRLRGFIAWWVRRTYYLLLTPGFERKLRIVADWTVALFLAPDVVKVDPASERVLRAGSAPAGAAARVRVEDVSIR